MHRGYCNSSRYCGPERLKEAELITVLMSCQDVEVTESGRVICRPALQNNNPRMHKCPQILTHKYSYQNQHVPYRGGECKRVEESHDYANIEGLRDVVANGRLVVSSAAGVR